MPATHNEVPVHIGDMCILWSTCARAMLVPLPDGTHWKVVVEIDPDNVQQYVGVFNRKELGEHYIRQIHYQMSRWSPADYLLITLQDKETGRVFQTVGARRRRC